MTVQRVALLYAIHRKTDIRRHLHQQLADFGVERIHLVQKQGDGTDHKLAAVQRQSRGGAPAERLGTLLPRRGAFVVLEVLAPDGPVLPKATARQPLPQRVVAGNRHLDALDIRSALAKVRHWQQLLRTGVNHANPCELQATGLHRGPANRVKQLFLIGTTHNRLVALAQRRVHPAELENFPLGCAALADIVDDGGKQQTLPHHAVRQRKLDRKQLAILAPRRQFNHLAGQLVNTRLHVTLKTGIMRRPVLLWRQQSGWLAEGLGL